MPNTQCMWSMIADKATGTRNMLSASINNKYTREIHLAWITDTFTIGMETFVQKVKRKEAEMFNGIWLPLRAVNPMT